MKSFDDLDKIVDFIIVNKMPKEVVEYGNENEITDKYKWFFDFAESWPAHRTQAALEIRPCILSSILYRGVTFIFIDITK